jgi:hypothetical protein
MKNFEVTFYDEHGHVDEKSTGEMNALMRIAHADRMRREQEQKIEDATYLRDLAKADFVKQVQSLKSPYDDRDNLFEKAQRYLLKNDSACEAHFDVLQDELRADFFDGDSRVELVSISGVSLTEYAWFVEFKFGDTKLAIQIPRRHNLTVDNVDRADDGKFQWSIETSKNNWMLMGDNYCVKPIADQICEHFYQ